MENDSKNTMLIVGCAILGLCLCGLAVLAGGAFLIYESARTVGPGSTPVVIFPGFDTPTPVRPTEKPDIIRTPVPTPLPGAGETLAILQEEIIPESDLREIAIRLKGIADIPETVSDTPADHAEGAEVDFSVTNNDTQETFQVTARMVYKRENVYFFAENDQDVDEREVRELVDAFQDEMYPIDREFFGSEWNPGVDGDPRLYILYTHGLGDNIAGYYSSADEYSRLAHEFSNEKEMFYINADNQDLGDEYVYAVLAHEFQHMIHWYHDRNEESWMNEGSSELAVLLNGYDTGGFDYSFVGDPDLQLNAWDTNNPSHYGAAFMFMAYFLDRFGSEMTQALVAHPANGIQAVQDVLAENAATDPQTGEPTTALDVFADWTIANLLSDGDVADGRYDYESYASAPRVTDYTARLNDCPTSKKSTVTQFGTDYYEIRCPGEVTIDFIGSQQVRVVPADPNSGRYAFWSNRNDQSDSRLTRAFDLTGVDQATLTYSMWYLIEKDWDYLYLVVSEDDGVTWTIIETPSCSSTDPTGNNLGCGYTGASGGGDPESGADGEWVEESVDLSAYAGKNILVRFEYVTDAAANYDSFMLDDVAVPELDYRTDFEADDGGWDGEGFVRIDNLLQQKFIVQVVKKTDNASDTTVERLELDATNLGSLTLTLGSGERAVLVISGVTPFTTEKASYEFEVK